MDAIILDNNQLDVIGNMQGESKTDLAKTPVKEENDFIDNVEFIRMMRISKRTAQTWRDEGLISFSQIGKKIYYRISDIQKMLDKNCQPAYNKKKYGR